MVPASAHVAHRAAAATERRTAALKNSLGARPNDLANDKSMNTNATIIMEYQPQAHAERSQHEVAQRAYQLWEAAGRPSGRDLENWLQAEAELLRASQPRHVNFGTSDSNPVRAIETVKEKSTPAVAASRRKGPKPHAGSRAEGGFQLAGSRIR